MTVPFSEDVARSVPVELMDKEEMGALWAWMTLATVRERVEKRRTSPDWEAPEVDEAGGTDEEELEGCREGWVDNGDWGEGTGEGYARYELSADGDRAQIAFGFGVVSMTWSRRMLEMS